MSKKKKRFCKLALVSFYNGENFLYSVRSNEEITLNKVSNFFKDTEHALEFDVEFLKIKTLFI
jgi:hypothetical protein